MKTLVVFYSRTGNTRKLAHLIAASMHAQIEEIVDGVDRGGLFGYLRSSGEGWFGGRTEIVRPRYDPGAFDLVIVGTPVWRASVASPVRTYLEDFAPKLERVAFFCTLDSMGGRYALDEMAQLSGRPALTTLACTERRLASPELWRDVEAFAARLRDACADRPQSGGAESNRSQGAP